MNTIQNTVTSPATISLMLNKLGGIEPDIRESIFDSILPLISSVNGKFYPPWLEKYYEEYSEMTPEQKRIFNNKSSAEQIYLVNNCRRNTMIIYSNMFDDSEDDDDYY